MLVVSRGHSPIGFSMKIGPVFGTSAPLSLLLVAAAGLAVASSGLAADKTAPPNAAGTYVIVARAVQGCFFDTVRVSGYLVPRQEIQIPFEAEGYRITEVSAGEGDKVTSGQQLAKLARLTGDPAPSPPAANTAPAIVRAPSAGTIVKATAGRRASRRRRQRSDRLPLPAASRFSGLPSKDRWSSKQRSREYSSPS